MPIEAALAPWRVDQHAWPGGAAPLADRIRFLVSYAILAPSSHNTQPWLFRIGESSVDVWADRSRALPVVDHDDRELTMSCACAAFNLATAARYFNHEAICEILPDPQHAELVARVHIGGERPHDRDDKALFSAITRRRTCRQPFSREEIDRGLLQRLDAAAENEGAWLHFVHERRSRLEVAEIIAEGDRIQFHDRRFRRELAAWIHPNRWRGRDGMPGAAHGMGDVASLVGPLVIRTFDLGSRTAARDADLVEHSPMLAIIGTREDTPRDWIHAGLALEHVLLLATSAGLSASFLNQPIEVAELRPRLARMIGHHDHPQVLLRLGFGPEVPPTPRRPASEVIVPSVLVTSPAALSG